MLYEAVVNLIGEIPVGFEPVVYVGCLILLLWLVNTTFSILFSVVNWIGGK